MYKLNKLGDNNEFEVAPLRSLDDFLLKGARFQIPTIGDLEKWGNRVTSNLMYYQTNYFLLSLLIFTVIGYVFETMSYRILNHIPFYVSVLYIRLKWLVAS